MSSKDSYQNRRRGRLRHIYFLVPTREVEHPSPRLPMSAATRKTINTQLLPHSDVNTTQAMRFLPTIEDPRPLLLTTKPVREAGVEHFVPSFSTSSSMLKGLTDLWSSMSAAQTYGWYGKVQLTSIQDQISFLGMVWGWRKGPGQPGGDSPTRLRVLP